MPAVAMNFLKYLPAIKSGYDWVTGGTKMPTRAGSMSPYEKNYISALKNRASQGMSPEEVMNNMNLTTRNIAPGMQMAKTNIRGKTISQGIEGSGVAAEMEKDVDLAGNVEIAKTARAIAKRNQEIKDKATADLGKYGMDQTNIRYQEALRDRARRDSAGTDFMGHVSGFAGDFMQKKTMDRLLKRIKDEGWDVSDDVLMKLLAGLTG